MRAPGVLYQPKLEMFPALRWPCFSLTLLALRIASYSRRHIRTIVYGMCLHDRPWRLGGRAHRSRCSLVRVASYSRWHVRTTVYAPPEDVT